jgi:DNA-binding transcriptional MerR regulator
MYTIGQLVKEFKLSRSSLLYYDKIGLLKPSGRSDANYRLYTQSDFNRMLQISIYKEAGLSLDSIAELLVCSASQSSQLLEQRLNSLNLEMSRLRQQQQLIVKLLGKNSLLRQSKVMNKEQWVNILKASGMDENAMRQWHIEFERDLPEAHSDFLESLGIDTKEITKIKAWSKAASEAKVRQ